MNVGDCALTLADVKNIVETFAFFCAGAFFVYKALSGYLITNMSINVASTRRRIPGSLNDYLNIKITLKKGDKGTAQIHDVQARVRTGDAKEQFVVVDGIDRRSFKAVQFGNKERKLVNWEKRSEKPFLNLSSGEETQFSCLTQVPADLPCTIEVAVLGKRLWSCRIGQWRASCVSLPEQT